MKTIFSDGETLEIEKRLNCTVFLPQNCHFCNDKIMKFGVESGSLCFHSLDENHKNWTPSNKRPVHRGCHQRYHCSGEKSASKRPEVREKFSKAIMGDKNPMKRPEVAAKHTGDKHHMRHPEFPIKVWKTRRERYGPSGMKDPEKYYRERSQAMKKGVAQKIWKTRRERYGPTGMKH